MQYHPWLSIIGFFAGLAAVAGFSAWIAPRTWRAIDRFTGVSK